MQPTASLLDRVSDLTRWCQRMRSVNVSQSLHSEIFLQQIGDRECLEMQGAWNEMLLVPAIAAFPELFPLPRVGMSHAHWLRLFQKWIAPAGVPTTGWVGAPRLRPAALLTVEDWRILYMLQPWSVVAKSKPSALLQPRWPLALYDLSGTRRSAAFVSSVSLLSWFGATLTTQY